MREKFKILKFFFNLVKNMQANLFFIRGIYSLFKTLEILVIMYIPSIIIMMLSKNLSYEMLIIAVIGGLILLLALRIGNKFLNRNGYIMENKFSQSLLRDISNKIMTVPFSQIEDSEFVAKKEEALFPITSQNSIGETFRVIPTLLQATIMLVSVLAILLAYEPILMIIAVVLAGLSFGLSRTMIKSEAKHGLNSARQNKEYVYYLRVMRSPEIAKDVRIYQMQPFFMDKLKTLFNLYVDISKLISITRIQGIS